jgi:hypothetical protein
MEDMPKYRNATFVSSLPTRDVDLNSYLKPQSTPGDSRTFHDLRRG